MKIFFDMFINTFLNLLKSISKLLGSLIDLSYIPIIPLLLLYKLDKY